MIIAVTGGTGFIGRHLINKHLARGDEVRYLSRRHHAHAVVAGAVPFVGDLISPTNALSEFLHGVDVLYHCAAELHDETLIQATNVEGTANLLFAAEGKIKRWIQLSSTGVYGNPRHQQIDETASLFPQNAYERSKAKADELVLDAVEQRRIPECVLVRPSNVFGNDMPNQSLFQLISMINKGWFFHIGSQSAMANYIHVDNVVEALIVCAIAELPSSSPVYIVSDHCPLHQWVETISAALNKSAPWLRVPESFARLLAKLGRSIPHFPMTTSRINALTNSTIYKSDAIKAELGYQHPVSLQTGMTLLTQYWQTHQH